MSQGAFSWRVGGGFGGDFLGREDFMELHKTTLSDLGLEGEIFDFSERTFLGFETLGIFFRWCWNFLRNIFRLMLRILFFIRVSYFMNSVVNTLSFPYSYPSYDRL